MAHVIITLKIMPADASINLTSLQTTIQKKIEAFGAFVAKIVTEPIAFGLQALVITFSYDEKKGTSDPLEEDIKTIAGVGTVDVIDVRRAFG